MKTLMAVLVAALLVHPVAASAQERPDPALWKSFAEKVDVGSRITVRLHDGRRIAATLVQANDAALMIQPRTRVPVPVQPVPYEAIASIERDSGVGITAGKAVAIGVGAGAATFAGIFIILLAVLGD